MINIIETKKIHFQIDSGAFANDRRVEPIRSGGVFILGQNQVLKNNMNLFIQVPKSQIYNYTPIKTILCSNFAPMIKLFPEVEGYMQGTNARKVISEVSVSFVMQ